MDYRDNNPRVLQWTDLILKTEAMLCPFDGFILPAVFEYFDPTSEMTFLSFLSHSHEDSDYNIHSTSYVIQAPRNCPMRHKFTVGEITWEEYWTHSPWLIELTCQSIICDVATVRYISPKDLPAEALRLLRSESLKSPMEMKLMNLEFFLYDTNFHPERDLERKRKYREFIARFGQYLQESAA